MKSSFHVVYFSEFSSDKHDLRMNISGNCLQRKKQKQWVLYRPEV
jgi:hypothetical protein